jgi:hypothetical protein
MPNLRPTMPPPSLVELLLLIVSARGCFCGTYKSSVKLDSCGIGLRIASFYKRAKSRENFAHKVCVFAEWSFLAVFM